MAWASRDRLAKVGVLNCSSPSSPATGWTAASYNGSLTYDTKTGQYSFVWKTDKTWAGSCRQLSLKFDDWHTHTVSFRFTK